MDAFRRSIAVVVGIDSYGAGIPRLGSARRDAERLGTLLREAHGYDVRFLLDEEATGEQLLRVLTRDLTEDVGAEDRVLFYFAGHGVALDGDGGVNGYLLPADAQRGVETSYLHMPRVHDALIALGCRHLLVVLDCCFAGAFRWSGTRDLMTLPTVIHQERLDRFVRSPAWQVITSAASDQKALDQLPAGPLGSRGEGAHSPFALALFEGLAGAGDVVPAGRGDGVITATELYVYIEDRLQPETMRSGAGQTPRLWPLRKHDKGEFIFLVPGRALDLPPAPPLDYAANPYVGLRSFEASEADLFFGRSEVVRELAEHVRARPLSVVLGASGTGKSSVVKAGLLPFLATHDADSIVAPVIRPGPDPIAALRSALAAVVPALEERDMGEVPDAAIERGIAAWCLENEGRRLVVVVDQLEELVTLARDATVKGHVVALLERLVTRHADQLRVVVTLRSDFEPALAELAWAARWTDARYVLRPMTQDELRRVIEAPASRRVLYFEPSALVDELINEVVATPGGLPLLSFALSEMYIHFVNRRSSDRAITEEDYHAVGGVIGALRARADREYDALDPMHRATMRRVMLRMVAFGSSGGVRRRVWRSELVFDDEAENARVAHVLERLSAARLIVMGHDDGGEPWVEPAHDALVGAWNLLIGWVREANADPIADLRFQRALAQSARDWSGEADAKVREGLLWKDPVRGGILGKLTAAEASGLNRQERSFARRSIRARRRARAVLVATFVIIAALAGAAIIAAVRASASARQARDEASAARAALLGRMAVTADGEGPDDTEVIRLLLAAEAVRLGASTTDLRRVPDAENVIRRADAGTHGTRLAGYQQPIPRQVNASSWSHFTADGRWLLTGNLLTARAHVWDLHAPRPAEAHAFIDGLQSRSPSPPLVATAGPWLFTVTDTGSVVRVDARNTREPDWASPGRVLDVPFSDDGTLLTSPDERWLAGAASTGEAWLVDLAAPILTPRLLPGTAGPVAFSAGADWLVSGAKGGVRIHDLRSAEAPPRTVTGIDAPRAVSPGATWVVGTLDGESRIVHAATGRIAGVIPGPDPYGVHEWATFSADEAWLIVRPYEDAYELWRLDSEGATAERIEEGGTASLDGAGTRVISSPSPDRIVVRDAAGATRTVEGARPPFRVHGRLLAARAADGTVAIHDLDHPESGPYTVPEREGRPLAWGGDGDRLITLGDADPEDEPDTGRETFRFWVIDAAARRASLGEQGSTPDWADVGSVSPDGRWWLSAGTRTAHLVDLSAVGAADPMTDLPPVSARAWTNGGSVLVTGHADGSIRTWSADGPAPAPLARVEGPGEVIWLDVTPDGRWLLTQHPAQLLLWAHDGTRYTVAGDAAVLDLDPAALRDSPADQVVFDMDAMEYAPGETRPLLEFGAAATTVETVLADGRVASWHVDSIVQATRERRPARSMAPVVAPPAGARLVLAQLGDSLEVRDARNGGARVLRIAAGTAVISDDQRWLAEGCTGITADGRWAYTSGPAFWLVDARARAATPRSAAADAAYVEGEWSCILHPLTGASRRPDTLFDSSALYLPETGGGLAPVGMQVAPDGRWVVVRWAYNAFADCGYTSDLRLMDLHAADPVATLVPIELSAAGGCPPVEFSPDGRWLAAGALLRDLAPTADVAQSIWLPAPVLTFDPAGRFVVTMTETEWIPGMPADEDASVTLRFVALEPDALIDTACRLAGRNPSHEEWRRFFPGEAYRPICPRLPLP